MAIWFYTGSGCRRSAYDPHDVPIEYKDHQGEEHEESHLRGAFAVFFADRFSLDDFNEKEKYVAPVKNGDRQQV